MFRSEVIRIFRGIGLLRMAFYFLLPLFALVLKSRSLIPIGFGFILALLLTGFIGFRLMIDNNERKNALFLIGADLLALGYSVFLFRSWDLYPLFFMPMSLAAIHLKPWYSGVIGALVILYEALVLGFSGHFGFYIVLHFTFTCIFVIILYKMLDRIKQEKLERNELSAVLDDLREAHDYLKIRNKDLALMARTDALTEVFNYRFFQENLSKHIEYGRRYQRPVSLLMIDIDFFKKLNDTFGHRSGDRALKFVADTIRRNVRSDDLVCRYGGEEFAVILPRTDLDQAVELAERIRSAVRESTLKNHAFGPITISIGASAYPAEACGIYELVECADRSLYEAKRQGRDRVVVNRILNPSSNEIKRMGAKKDDQRNEATGSIQ